MSGIGSWTEAEYEFRGARRSATLASIFARISGVDDSLISLDEAKSILAPKAQAYAGRKTVRIDQIVGSEERYRDFNQHFLPKRNFLRQRWKSISMAHQEFKNLPPVELYEVGGLYFIRDGNHRVAVAKRRGIEFIEADVTSLATDVQLPPVASTEELRKAVLEYEHDRFLELLPTGDIRFTAPGRYDDLAVHIACHRAILGEVRGKKPSLEDATRSWYHGVYLPIVGFIRDSKVLSFLPERTEADFYVWLVRHWNEVFRSKPRLCRFPLRRRFERLIRHR